MQGKIPFAPEKTLIIFGEGNRLFTEFKGALTENFDFFIQRENDIFPDKVKLYAHLTEQQAASVEIYFHAPIAF